jgi:hypothetical protein
MCAYGPHYRTWACGKSNRGNGVFALLNVSMNPPLRLSIQMLFRGANSRMDIFADKHHQRITRAQIVRAEQAILAAELAFYFGDLRLQRDHNWL